MRDIYEVANQLGSYVGPKTEDGLKKFLLRESGAASDLADEIVRLLASQILDVEGWVTLAPSYHRDPYQVLQIMGDWTLVYNYPNGSSRRVGGYPDAITAIKAAEALLESE